jgi:hypothetical protein
VSATPAEEPTTALEPLRPAEREGAPAWILGAVAGVLSLGAAAIGGGVGLLAAFGIVPLEPEDVGEGGRATIAVLCLLGGALAGLSMSIRMMRWAGASASARWHLLVFSLSVSAGLGTALSPLRSAGGLAAGISAALTTAALAGAALLRPDPVKPTAEPISIAGPPSIGEVP